MTTTETERAYRRRAVRKAQAERGLLAAGVEYLDRTKVRGTTIRQRRADLAERFVSATVQASLRYGEKIAGEITSPTNALDQVLAGLDSEAFGELFSHGEARLRFDERSFDEAERAAEARADGY